MSKAHTIQTGIAAEVSIREARREDCPRLMELVRELALYEKAPGEVTVTLEHFAESGFGSNPVWWAIVAEAPASPGSEEKYIIGFALYYIRYSTWKGQRMYLEDLLITESWRGKGVGKMLFDQLFQEAKKKALPAIAWQVLEWNEPAINFYKKLNASFDGEWVNCAVTI